MNREQVLDQSSPEVRCKRAISNRQNAKHIPQCLLKKSLDLQFSTLSFTSNPQNTRKRVEKRFTLQNLIDYVKQALNEVYSQDKICIKQQVFQFLKSKLPQLKSKIQQRLSLLKYLEQSLQYKYFSEINTYIQKEWKRNALLYIIGTFWSKCILQYKFNNITEFIVEYHKYRNFISNITYYYFKNSLKILNSKNISTFNYILEDSAHQIINNLKDWHKIYQEVILLTLEKNKHKEQEINIDFDLGHLQINQSYLNVKKNANQLQKTTQFIKEFAQQIRIHEKIELLRKIRSTFLEEIQINRNIISAQNRSQKTQQFQKDDVIGCMIYCIIKGQVGKLSKSMKIFTLLLGKNNDLLSRKGVDSYKADIECAVEYLSKQQGFNGLQDSILVKPPNLMTQASFGIEND